MRAKSIVGLAVSSLLAAALQAQDAGQSKVNMVMTAETPSFTQSSDMKWADLDPKGAPGIKIADVWGDHTKSGYGAFLKFPAGFLAPLHTHTDAIKIVVISGTYTQAPEGKAEMRMGPGSYVFQPGGSYKHTTGCDKASECLIFIESTGPFDLKMVAGAK